MKINIKAKRDGRDSYMCFEGMSLEVVRDLVGNLGGTDIQVISEEEMQAYLDSQRN